MLNLKRTINQKRLTKILNKNKVTFFKDKSFKNLEFNSIIGISFTNCVFVNCKFNRIDNIDFIKSSFYNCAFYTTMRYTFFTKSFLSNSKIENNEMYKVNFTETDFRNLIAFNYKMRDCSQLNCLYLDPEKANERTKTFFNKLIVKRIPPVGSFIAYKKIRNGLIVKLRIPEYAQRCITLSNKCRASEAKVLEIYNSKTGKEVGDKIIGKSFFNPYFAYRKGATVHCSPLFDNNFLKQCGSGIHFFLTKEEAQEY